MEVVDGPEFQRLAQLLREAVPDPGKRTEIMFAVITYCTARACAAIDRAIAIMEKKDG